MRRWVSNIMTRNSWMIPDYVLIKSELLLNYLVILRCRFVRVWKIPETGLSAPTNEPVCKFPAHAEKIQIVKFHPFAKDIIVTSAFDKTVKVWDLTDNDEAKFDLQVNIRETF